MYLLLKLNPQFTSCLNLLQETPSFIWSGSVGPDLLPAGTSLQASLPLVSWNPCLSHSWFFSPPSHFDGVLPQGIAWRIKFWEPGYLECVVWPLYSSERLDIGHPPFSISQCYSWSVSSSDSWALISDCVFFFEACRILCEMQNTQCSDVPCSLFSSNVLPAFWAPLFWKLLIFSAGCFSWLIWFLSVLSLSRIQLLDLLDWQSDFLRLPISFWKHNPCIEFFSLYFLALSLNLSVPILWPPVFVSWM